MNGKTQFEKDLEQDLKDPEYAKEFYLGLGAIREQQRIIKLLESIRVGSHWIGRDYAIALIKGEEA